MRLLFVLLIGLLNSSLIQASELKVGDRVLLFETKYLNTDNVWITNDSSGQAHVLTKRRTSNSNEHYFFTYDLQGNLVKSDKGIYNCVTLVYEKTYIVETCGEYPVTNTVTGERFEIDWFSHNPRLDVERSYLYLLNGEAHLILLGSEGSKALLLDFNLKDLSHPKVIILNDGAHASFNAKNYGYFFKDGKPYFWTIHETQNENSQRYPNLNRLPQYTLVDLTSHQKIFETHAVGCHGRKIDRTPIVIKGEVLLAIPTHHNCFDSMFDGADERLSSSGLGLIDPFTFSLKIWIEAEMSSPFSMNPFNRMHVVGNPGDQFILGMGGFSSTFGYADLNQELLIFNRTASGASVTNNMVRAFTVAGRNLMYLEESNYLVNDRSFIQDFNTGEILLEVNLKPYNGDRPFEILKMFESDKKGFTIEKEKISQSNPEQYYIRRIF